MNENKNQPHFEPVDTTITALGFWLQQYRKNHNMPPEYMAGVFQMDSEFFGMLESGRMKAPASFYLYAIDAFDSRGLELELLSTAIAVHNSGIQESGYLRSAIKAHFEGREYDAATQVKAMRERGLSCP